MNEEEIKLKVLLPYLIDLGIDHSEISLEFSFKIRLGNSIHKLKSDIKSGRADVLCHKNGKNIFILELKSEAKSVTEEDIDQGVSYARLLDNIAPFVIVTNGKETVIVDTITKDRLNGVKISTLSSFWKNDCTLSTEEDLALRHSALKYFIAFSNENLKVFCKYQVTTRMSTLIGERYDLNAKYIKELYTDRTGLKESFSNFLLSQYSVFAITGESGVGKSNSLCDLCLDYLTENSCFVLFYNGGLLDRSPVDLICSDLNLFFSANTEKNKTLSKLNSIASELNTTIILFIDAVDESTYQNINFELSEIALAVKNNDKIKLCISCKSELWDFFLYPNRIKSYLFDALYPSSSIVNEASDSNERPGFELKRFDDIELTGILEKYRKLFSFKGEITGWLREDLRLAFLLRLISHVYKGRQLPAEIHDFDLISKYLRQKITQVKELEYDSAIRILSEIGKLIIEKETELDTSTISYLTNTSIDIDQVVKYLNLSIYEDIPKSLFATNVLVKENSQDKVRITFYFSKIRDYVICNLSYNLADLSDEEFESTIETFFNGPVGLSSIYFYSKNAKYSHRQILEKHKRYKLLTFVEEYNICLDKHFFNTKSSFDPFTDGSIGMVLTDKLSSDRGGFALIPLKNRNDPKILELDRYDFKSRDPIFSELGAHRITGGYDLIILQKPKKQVNKLVLNQLENIINKGKLNENSSKILLIEKAINIIYFYYEQLGYRQKINDRFYPRYSAIYPIDLHEILDKIYRFFANHYYKNKQIGELIESGEITVSNGTYLFSHDQLDWAAIKDKVNAALKNKIIIPEPNVTGHFPPFVALKNIIENLIKLGTCKITEHFLPTPDIPVNQIDEELARRGLNNRMIPNIIAAQFSQGQMIEFAKRYFTLLEEAYSEIVESCFPIVKENFKFYSSIPHKYFINLPDESHDFQYYGYGFGYSDEKCSNVSFEFIELQGEYERFWENLKKNNISSFYHSDLSTLLSERLQPRKTVSSIDTSKVDEYCIIRNRMYEFLKSDFDHIKSKISFC